MLGASVDELFAVAEVEVVLKQIRELVAAGLSDREIGRRVGYSGVVVGRHRRALELEHAGPSRARRDSSTRERHWKCASELRAAGASGPEIAAELGISRRTVSRDLGGLGWDVHRERSRQRAAARHAAVRGEVDRLKTEHGWLEDRDVDELHGLKPGRFFASYVRPGYVEPVRRIGSGSKAVMLFRQADVDPLPFRGEHAEAWAEQLEAEWKVGGPLPRAAIGRPCVAGRTRSAKNGAWKLGEVRETGRKKKGEARALEVSEAAIELLERHRSRMATYPRETRRTIIDVLIARFESEAAAARPARDPEHRKARARIVRALHRGRDLLGAPELASLATGS